MNEDNKRIRRNARVRNANMMRNRAAVVLIPIKRVEVLTIGETREVREIMFLSLGAGCAPGES